MLTVTQSEKEKMAFFCHKVEIYKNTQKLKDYSLSIKTRSQIATIGKKEDKERKKRKG